MFFFFNDTATTEIYTLSLHDALPIRRHEDRSEYIIQIVGNASSQGPNAFHPLSAEEFLFQTLLLGDVQECAQNPWPARVFGQYVVDFHIDQAAVLAPHPKFIGRTEDLASQAFLKISGRNGTIFLDD